MSLASLPPLLRDEPALSVVSGRSNAVVAVPEAARAIVIAALARRSAQRPFVIATPTGTMAGQLYDDLVQFLPPHEVALFPAWETLPFERVSPGVETMGRRLETLWKLASPDRCPLVVVAGVRALLQRLGPGDTDIDPIHVRPGSVLDPDVLLRRLVHMGYRREELVEHRGEVARRGAIIDVFPSHQQSQVRAQLAFVPYGHVRWSATGAMDDVLDAYAPHHGALPFPAWVRDVYAPQWRAGAR